MSDTRRTSRMASLIRAEMARVILEEVSDPSLREVVVTDVNLSKDLKSARVFFVSGQAVPSEVDKGLHRALPFFRRRLGETLELRWVPTLEFKRDTHGDSVHHLMGLFDSLERSSKEPTPSE